MKEPWDASGGSDKQEKEEVKTWSQGYHREAVPLILSWIRNAVSIKSSLIARKRSFSDAGTDFNTVVGHLGIEIRRGEWIHNVIQVQLDKCAVWLYLLDCNKTCVATKLQKYRDPFQKSQQSWLARHELQIILTISQYLSDESIVQNSEYLSSLRIACPNQFAAHSRRTHKSQQPREEQQDPWCSTNTDI